MSVVISVADVVSSALPKILPSKAHAVADTVISGAFFLAGVAYWRRNRRAALGALACGGLHLATSILTSYDRQQGKPISLALHRKMELGIAAMIAAVPEFLQFEDSPERKTFLLQAAAIVALANMTRVKPSGVEARARAA
jgi:hypothetical protein